MARIALLFLLLLPLALHAEEAYGVGEAVDDHEVEHWINPPAWPNFSDLRGDVIVFKKWGCT